MIYDRKIIVSINFNAMKLTDKRLTQEWIENRIDIFMNFTFKSLINQTNSSFLTILACDPSSMEIINQALSTNPNLPENIKFISSKEYDRTILDYIGNCPKFFLARIDSDDMYHKSYIQQLYDIHPQEYTAALINQRGYMYDSINKRMAHWYHFSPPFYTFIYNTEDYVRGIRYKLLGGHSKIIRFCHEIMPEGNFMVVVHSGNTTNHFNRSMRGALISDPAEITTILEQFGLTE